jgi:hypothetical protein
MNNQVSTALLLVVLGFLIYYLTKPKRVSEDFADAPKATTTPSTPATPASSASSASTPATKVPDVKPEVLKQIVATPPASPAPVAPTKTIVGNQTGSMSFEANDLDQSGASLNDAFARPIPTSARPDVVDMNKNNVKKYDAKDFLPKEINKKWFDTDFSQAKYNLNDDKLINTERYVIGINTVGQSLKNASYDIRGTVPNPKFSVSPWNNSTYEPDYNLKSLC